MTIIYIVVRNGEIDSVFSDRQVAEKRRIQIPGARVVVRELCLE